MSFIVYLHFQGRAREALQAYQAVFGGKLDLGTYVEAPPGMVPDAPGLLGSDLIMHGQLTLDSGAMLMAADFAASDEGRPAPSMSIAWFARDVPDAQRIFDALAEGGSVLMPVAPVFWAEGFGMLTDRFGVQWFISTPYLTA